MLKIEQIVCPTDFSEFSERAYRYAWSLAQHYNAKLYLYHVVQPLTSAYPYYAFPESVNELHWHLRAHAEQQLKEFLLKYPHNGIQPECTVEQGIATESILGFARNRAVDLIVMGTHGRQGVDRMTMGSVTEKGLRKAHCPVLAVRKPSHDFVSPGDLQNPVNLRKILFCTDFSRYSERALQHALSLAMEYNAELTLLHVLEDFPTSKELQSVIEEELHRLDKSVPHETRDWFAIKSIVLVGKPYQEIIQLGLESQADLVVMGVRGRSALDIGLFGSTTHRVIQLGSCPVLAVHV